MHFLCLGLYIPNYFSSTDNWTIQWDGSVFHMDIFSSQFIPFPLHLFRNDPLNVLFSEWSTNSPKSYTLTSRKSTHNETGPNPIFEASLTTASPARVSFGHSPGPSTVPRKPVRLWQREIKQGLSRGKVEIDVSASSKFSNQETRTAVSD